MLDFWRSGTFALIQLTTVTAGGNTILAIQIITVQF